MDIKRQQYLDQLIQHLGKILLFGSWNQKRSLRLSPARRDTYHGEYHIQWIAYERISCRCGYGGSQRARQKWQVVQKAVGGERYYIQSAFAMPTLEKEAQESASLLRIKDSFKKIIIVKDDIKPKRNEDGILTIGLKDFLLDKNSLNY